MQHLLIKANFLDKEFGAKLSMSSARQPILLTINRGEFYLCNISWNASSVIGLAV
jgi:hypothetical protein